MKQYTKLEKALIEERKQKILPVLAALAREQQERNAMTEKTAAESDTIATDIRECATAKGIPPHMIAALERYVCARVPCGGFLTAVLSNDLVGAAAQADDVNKYLLFEYAAVLYQGIPSVCWGSRSKVQRWLARAENDANSEDT